jgi:hypothetical protein
MVWWLAKVVAGIDIGRKARIRVRVKAQRLNIISVRHIRSFQRCLTWIISIYQRSSNNIVWSLPTRCSERYRGCKNSVTRHLLMLDWRDISSYCIYSSGDSNVNHEEQKEIFYNGMIESFGLNLFSLR